MADLVRSKPEDNVPQWVDTLRWLRERGIEGVHTAEMHKAFIANAGQRKAEIERELGVKLTTRRERSPFGPSMGARYWLPEFAPQPQDGVAGAETLPGDEQGHAPGRERLTPDGVPTAASSTAGPCAPAPATARMGIHTDDLPQSNLTEWVEADGDDGWLTEGQVAA